MSDSRYWIELSTRQIAALPPGTIAILPVAAVEQHGPHLPVGTDALINRGILAHAIERMAPDMPVVILPEQMIGNSMEHLSFPGTLSHTAAATMEIWGTVLEGALRAGITKVLLFNSHGGQVKQLQPTALMLRQRFGAMAFYASWFDAGYPEGLFSDDEIAFGIHGGAIETSMMLHLYPHLVATDHIADFPSRAKDLETAFSLLQTDPGNGRMAGFGWMMQDLHPSGASGDARQATVEKGNALVERAAERLIQVIGDIAAFDETRLSAMTGVAADINEPLGNGKGIQE
ncbi:MULTISPECIES: creatininase family protein [Rhizobium]|uniref:creatininase family protein n=1 Tax=unclassified Rhizobium TaxID=2613769 RepID=UPI001AD9C867|nr:MULTISPECIES: creatininase family protein [unclassified Rhizobium]MBO9101197.1 creatininase family protein [Rhizobium sp. L58/93]MBO9170846.1 creatininase family protein [Rhizobium sp. L245/93]MBO9186763.1 creatininase family protein [Rhizobium sp. E27B/91]QXZ86206.1 creatininase family protein [Rhizobium sp. K1/93]QXZ92338.1 creatininase family protein [Rhizobium sp. K15/93]